MLKTRANKKNADLETALDIEAVLEMPGHLLRRCHQIGVAVFLDECRAFDLTPPQFVTLTVLATYGPLDKATISGVAAFDRTTIAVVIKNLQDRGFVVTRASKADRRAKLNEITARGLSVRNAVQDHARRAQQRMLAPLSERERAELLRLLGKMANENNLLSRAPHRAHRTSDG